MMPEKVKTTEITISRTVAARPHEVFDLWMDPNSPGSPWFGVAKAVVQPVVDGLFYHVVQFGGQDWAHYGRFIALERGHRIEHTWMSQATRGLESVVSLTFEPEGDQTIIHLRHANVPDDEMGRQHRDGWGFVLETVAEKFDRRSKVS
jgi:uncharacterized protein YndB with AHSA1/START domain